MQYLNTNIFAKKVFLIVFLGILFLTISAFLYKKSYSNKIIDIPENSIVAQNNNFKDKIDFTFAIFGDVHYKGGEELDDLDNFTKAKNFIKSQNPDLVFTIGDNVSSCSEGKTCQDKIKQWKNALGILNSKLFVVTGNHDVKSENKNTFSYWQENFNLPNNGPDNYKKLVYSFNYGNSHFIVLASDLKEHVIDDEQLNWLENDLKNNSKLNTFIFFHEPAFPISSKIDESLDKNEKQRDKLWKIIDEYKVTTVFSGHEHFHSRRSIDNSVFPQSKNKIYQIIIGNTNYLDHEHVPPKNLSDVNGLEYVNVEKGVLLVEVKENKVISKLYSVEGDLLNEFSLK